MSPKSSHWSARKSSKNFSLVLSPILSRFQLFFCPLYSSFSSALPSLSCCAPNSSFLFARSHHTVTCKGWSESTSYNL